MWLCGPHRPTTRLAVPEAPLLCSSMCPLLPLLSPPPIGSHVRIFVSFTVSIDASVATGTCPSIYGSCIHLTCTATPLSPVLSPPRLNPPLPPLPTPPTPTPCAAHLLLHARDPCRTDMPSPCPGMLSLQCHRHTQRLPVCHGHACVLVATAKDSGGCRLCWRSVCVLGTMGGAWERQEAALGACRASETHEQRPSPAAAQLGWQLEPRISNIMTHYSRAHQTPTQLTHGWYDHTHEVWWPNSQRSFRNHDWRVRGVSRGAP